MNDILDVDDRLRETIENLDDIIDFINTEKWLDKNEYDDKWVDEIVNPAYQLIESALLCVRKARELFVDDINEAHSIWNDHE